MTRARQRAWTFGILAVVIEVLVYLSIPNPTKLTPIEGRVVDIRRFVDRFSLHPIVRRTHMEVWVATSAGVVSLQHEEFRQFATGVNQMRVGDQITVLALMSRPTLGELWQVKRGDQTLLSYEQGVAWKYSWNCFDTRCAMLAALVSVLAFVYDLPLRRNPPPSV
jgi:hypothetical protein